MSANLPGTQRWTIKQDDRRRGAIVKMAETKAYEAWEQVHAKAFASPEEAFFSYLIDVDDTAMAMGATRDDHRHASVAFEGVWRNLGGQIPGDDPSPSSAVAVGMITLHPDSELQVVDAIREEIDKYADGRGHIRRLYVADHLPREIFEAIRNAGYDFVRRGSA